MSEAEDQVERDPLDPDDPHEVEEKTGPDEDFYPVEYSISSYGADYPVDGLVKRIENGSIFIPTFQRGYVWNTYRASRFVESLLLGLPVPAIFFSREKDSNKLLVIDGQQRLRTLQFFYRGIFAPTERQFKLKGVQERFKDATYQTLHENDRLRLDDSILHAIIITQEEPKEDGTSSVYHIFERLNTGGVLLHPQEIRSAICHGPFVNLLEQLNTNPAWRTLFGNTSSRMRDQELILRFFALLYTSESYSKPMKEFLTRFLRKNRNINLAATEFETVFANTTHTCLTAFGNKAFKQKNAVNAALCDSVMVGVARRQQRGPITDYAQAKDRYSELLQETRFGQAISSATTDEANVLDRLRLATEAFRECP